MEEKKTLTLKELKAKNHALKDKVLYDLEECFKQDFTVEEACAYSGIAQDTFYRWLRESEEFARLVDKWKTWIFTVAKKNLMNDINKGSMDSSKWVLERRQRKLYSTRVEQTGEDGKAIQHNITLSNYDKLTDEELQGLTSKQIRNERESE